MAFILFQIVLKEIESGLEMIVSSPFSIGYFLIFISWIPSFDGMTEEGNDSRRGLLPNVYLYQSSFQNPALRDSSANQFQMLKLGSH